MLRRYLITNAVSTVMLYGAVWGALPSITSAVEKSWSGAISYVMESPYLAPLVNGIITMSLG